MTFLVVSPGLAPDGHRGTIASRTLKAFDQAAGRHAERRMRPSGAAVWDLGSDASAARSTALDLLADEHRVDLALLQQPYRWRDFGVLAMDMDSTVITIECIDEIADYCGRKSEVAAITEAAMRGEIKDYADSLRRRVALLEGLSATVLDDVIRDRLRFTPGVHALVKAAIDAGLHSLLVSGGFEQFTSFVAAQVGFRQVRSNRLEIVDGRLTGRLLGTIVDATIKRETAAAACRARRMGSHCTVSVGDGANDLLMMQISGLSIAHRAKPAVAAQAMQAIRHGGLDNILDWFD
jgi:phosphoserine phosphatase